ncbi:MAG: GntR family transcriptional regulator [Anaerolineales bacterium]|nr:GntR family transcriptional regulator [Anaerolineales bacterium]
MTDMPFKLTPVSAGMTLTERVYVTLKEAILDLQIKPGSPLVEDDLARQMGTSKTPVRDALLTLERDGLVTKIPYKGTHVSEVAIRDATEIFELRAVLEGLAARLATPVFSLRDLDAAEDLLDQADAALAHGEVDACSVFGAQFHAVIHERADNRRLRPILDKLEEQLRRLRRLSNLLQGRLEKSGHEHRRVLAALRTGDAKQAENAMRAHLDSVVRDFAGDGDGALALGAYAAAPARGAGPAREPLPAGANHPALAKSHHNGDHA